MTPARERKEQRLRAAIRKAGLRVEPVGASGAVRIYGPGVYLLASELQYVSEIELIPTVEASGDTESSATPRS